MSSLEKFKINEIVEKANSVIGGNEKICFTKDIGADCYSDYIDCDGMHPL